MQKTICTCPDCRCKHDVYRSNKGSKSKLCEDCLTVRKRNVPKKVTIKKCYICSQEFNYVGRTNRNYCYDQPCVSKYRTLINEKIIRSMPKKEFKCIICSKQFLKYKSRVGVCSVGCYRIYYKNL